jgi:hypothetical protein
MTVSCRTLLWNEPHRAREVAGGLRVSGLIAWPYDDTNLPNLRRECLLDEDAQNGFLDSVVD